jgi:hypothetical protein
MSGDDHTQGTWILAIASLVFAVLVLPQVVEDGDSAALGAATPQISGLPTGSPPRRPPATV